MFSRSQEGIDYHRIIDAMYSIYIYIMYITYHLWFHKISTLYCQCTMYNLNTCDAELTQCLKVTTCSTKVHMWSSLVVGSGNSLVFRWDWEDSVGQKLPPNVGSSTQLRFWGGDPRFWRRMKLTSGTMKIEEGRCQSGQILSVGIPGDHELENPEAD